MKSSLTLGHYELIVDAENYSMNGSDVILTGPKINIELPFVSEKFFSHGWQSWSLTAWLDGKQQPAPSFPTSLHAMQVDPAYAFEKRPNGSWLGALKSPDGRTILFGALNLESHVVNDGKILTGSYEQGSGDWLLTIGPEQEVFNKYVNFLGKRYGKTNKLESPNIWCSWYSLYQEITENNLLRILSDMDNLPFDVFQIDDGWQLKIGDWEANEKFPSGMQFLANSIISAGKKAGLWLAPLIVVPSSKTFKNHRDWLIHDEKGNLVQAGVNWSEKLYALDTTHPKVLEWLTKLMKKVREWGFEYVKLDFLYAGALPGKRYRNIPRETAYRNGLETIRKALGDAFLLTCGAPILPSLGLCDAIRVGPDVSDVWNLNLESRLLNNFAVPGVQNAIRTSLNRLWLKPIVNTDPDVVFLRSRFNSLTQQQKNLLINLAEISAFKATSDLPSWLTDSERQKLNSFLSSKPKIQDNGQYNYLINGSICDFSEFIQLPEPLNGYEKFIQLFIKNLANISIIRMIFDKFSRAKIRKIINSEFKS